MSKVLLPCVPRWVCPCVGMLVTPRPSIQARSRAASAASSPERGQSMSMLTSPPMIKLPAGGRYPASSASTSC
eukprot:9049555-Lingulodinium_polyedra.AAC.1